MLCAVGATAQAPHIPTTDSNIRTDGVLDEPSWRSAWIIELEHEVSPGENIPAPVRTEVLVIHDGASLFVGFRVWDPEPASIRAHLTDRDSAWHDDWVGVVLDTFNDERRNYLFVVNPLGVQMDKIETWPDGGTPWDGIWDSASQITDWGWSAELRIPFSTLRFQRSQAAQTWGFDAIRSYPRLVRHHIGAFPRDRSNNCYLCQSIKIQGFEGASPGRNLEIAPTLTAARTDERPDFPDGAFETGDSEFEAGLTVRWGFTHNLTLAATLNPDFSQVEADARQLDINEPFALFFEEKRPFFMEGADFFSTPLDIVYTRTMRDPAWGLKMTGKEGPHTVGAYVVEDEITNLLFPGSEGSDSTSLEMSNTSAVGRYKLDIGDQFTLGALATSREGPGYHNRVGGFDADLRFSDTDRVKLQLLASSTRYPGDVVTEFDQPEGTFTDWAADLLYTHDTRTVSWWAHLRDIGRDFRADLGFLPRVDYRHGEVGGGYTWNATDTSWYSQLVLLAKLSQTEDQDGHLLEREAAIRFNYEGPLQSHAFIRPSLKKEGYNGQIFDLEEVFFHICLQPNAHSHAWVNLKIGDRVDYANTQAGERVFATAGFWYRFGRHLYLEPSYTHEQMDVAGGRLYDAEIGQITASWQFNARTFVRAILQNVDYAYNVELYHDEVDPEYEHLFTQLLFSYKVNPQTVFFLGYSDNSYGDPLAGLTRADRTLFVKLGYAWVL